MKKSSLSETPYGRLPGVIPLEVGDILTCDGGLRIVTEIDEKAEKANTITVVGPDHPRKINHTAAKSRVLEKRGAEGLAKFLAEKRQKQQEQPKTENDMNPKPKTTKAKTAAPKTDAASKTAKAKTPASEKPKTEKSKSFDGITDFIAEQVAAGKDDVALLEATKAKYPGCGPAWVRAVAAKKRAKAAAKA